MPSLAKTLRRQANTFAVLKATISPLTATTITRVSEDLRASLV
jgi:hypothetical protein